MPCKGNFVRNLSKNEEILPSRRYESYLQSANGLKRPFGVKNDRYGPCNGTNCYTTDTLPRSRNPENDISARPRTENISVAPPPFGQLRQRLDRLHTTRSSVEDVFKLRLASQSLPFISFKQSLDLKSCPIG